MYPVAPVTRQRRVSFSGTKTSISHDRVHKEFVAAAPMDYPLSGIRTVSSLQTLPNRAGRLPRAPARCRPVPLGAMSEGKRAEGHGISYASAGVDIEAGDRAVELFKPLAKKATRPEVRGGLGGFAGLFALRGGLPRTAAGLLHRRRRHQAGDRPGDGQARHRRPGPGRDGGRRPGGVRRRTAVPAGLHRRRPHRARTGRRDRLRYRRRLRAGRLRAAGRRDRRAPGPDGAGPLRHLRDRRRRRRGRRRARARPRQAR